MTERRTIRGEDHWLYVGRISHAPATGRAILEVIGGTFYAAQQLDPVVPEWPADEPPAEAVALAQQVASEGQAGVDALARAVRVVRAMEAAGLDPDDPHVRLASAVTLQVLADEIQGDDHG